MDAAVAQTQLQAIVDLVANSVPLVFTLWQSMLTVWGLVRKLLMRTAQPAALPIPVSTQTPQG
jgi:hypothetical protein